MWYSFYNAIPLGIFEKAKVISSTVVSWGQMDEANLEFQIVKK